MGTLLTAELLVHTAGMTEYPTAAKLAAHAGLAPVSRDSGAISGNHRGPRRYHRKLRHILWMATFTAIRQCPTSRAYCDKKRAEGKQRRQARSPSPDDTSTCSSRSFATARPHPTRPTRQHPRLTGNLHRRRLDRAGRQHPDLQDQPDSHRGPMCLCGPVLTAHRARNQARPGTRANRRRLARGLRVWGGSLRLP
ncbi:IS110 family transposase [Micromonospora sp. NBC_00860]|uniref:IS110 family transposase n=1 Tax=Micromonospora sp. NBC_00860 TaxID=2975980 RepID=UPI003866BD02|nr:IS110 family transposase [Micromonospora sp. NBC_00860]